jgi:hypothetical protein
MIVPADLIDAGTFAASALSTEVATGGAPPELDLPPPHPAMPSVTARIPNTTSQPRERGPVKVFISPSIARHPRSTYLRAWRQPQSPLLWSDG